MGKVEKTEPKAGDIAVRLKSARGNVAVHPVGRMYEFYVDPKKPSFVSKYFRYAKGYSMAPGVLRQLVWWPVGRPPLAAWPLLRRTVSSQGRVEELELGQSSLEELIKELLSPLEGSVRCIGPIT